MYTNIKKKKVFWESVGERGRKQERERNIHRLFLVRQALTRDWTYSPGLCPGWESNGWPFALWCDAQPAEPPSQCSRNFLNTVLKIDIGASKNSTSQTMSGERAVLFYCCQLVVGWYFWKKKINKNYPTTSNCYEVPKCLLPLLINVLSPRPAPIAGHTWSRVLLVFLRGGRART